MIEVSKVNVGSVVRVRVKVIGKMKSYLKNPVCRLLLPKVMETLVYSRFLFISWHGRGITGYERVERVLVRVLY